MTELMGFGVNIVTGDYSRGAAGIWIRDGELAFAVSEVTIAGTLQDMLNGIARDRHRPGIPRLGRRPDPHDRRDDRWRTLRSRPRTIVIALAVILILGVFGWLTFGPAPGRRLRPPG